MTASPLHNLTITNRARSIQETTFFVKGNSFSGSQEILLNLWNQKVHYRPQNSRLLVPILYRANPVHVLYPIHLRSIITVTAHTFSKSSASFRLTYQNPARMYLLLPTCHKPRPSHSPWLDHPNNIWWTAHTTQLLVTQFSAVSCYFLLYPHYLPQHPILKHR